MKLNLNKHQAADLLLQDDNINWSIEAAEKIVEYIEELEEDLGEEIDFDAVAIRCEFSELRLEEVLENYEFIRREFKEREKEDDEEEEEIIKDIIAKYTTCIEVSRDKVVIKDF